MASRGDEGRGMTAISLGELSSKPKPGIPEWGNPSFSRRIPPVEHIDWVEVTRGIETS